MDSSEAQRQIQQMTGFILSEATDKANEIQKRGEEEFSIEVHRLITEQKEKIRQTYERKVKQIETQYAIAKSMAINKQRLEKIKARQEVMGKISEDVREQLTQAMKDQAKSKAFITQLIVQGLLMLLEPEVVVRCRECDKALVNSCLAQAIADYSAVIKKESGATRTCKLSIDAKTYLPPAPVAGSDAPSCLGGVLLLCQEGKITIDNTMDLRLRLVMEQDKPAIRRPSFKVIVEVLRYLIRDASNNGKVAREPTRSSSRHTSQTAKQAPCHTGGTAKAACNDSGPEDAASTSDGEACTDSEAASGDEAETVQLAEDRSRSCRLWWA